MALVAESCREAKCLNKFSFRGSKEQLRVLLFDVHSHLVFFFDFFAAVQALNSDFSVSILSHLFSFATREQTPFPE